MPGNQNKRENPQRFISEEQELSYHKFTLMQSQEVMKDLDLQHETLRQILAQLEKENIEEERQFRELERKVAQEEKEIQQLKEEEGNCLEDKERRMANFEKEMQDNIIKARLLQEEHMRIDSNMEKKQTTLNELKDEVDLYRRRIQECDQIQKQLRQQTEEITFKKEEAIRFVTQSEGALQEIFMLKKRLNNELQEKKGAIRVYCRLRPPTDPKVRPVVEVTSENTLTLLTSKENVKSESQYVEQKYMFDHIFDYDAPQEKVFVEIAQLVQSAVDGKNVCIFAYGQTGSGKTYTLLGPPSHSQPASFPCNNDPKAMEDFDAEEGLTNRSLQMIFDEVESSRHFRWDYQIFLSITEIYNDTIIDLLKNPHQKENEASNRNTVDKLKEIPVIKYEEVRALVLTAMRERKMAATGMNQRSSRSHLIITLRLEASNGEQHRLGSLTFVDLAGSERLKQSKVVGENLKETQFINKSLSALGNVINEMKRKSEHIRFRDTKLTHALQKYLEGDSRTLMFVNVSPDAPDAFQTKISLQFAESVREVKKRNK